MRLTLVGVVTLALLEGLSGAVAAQEDDAEGMSAGPAPVAGTAIEKRLLQLASTSYDEDRIRHRGAKYEDIITLDDARLSGTMWQVWNTDNLPDASGKTFGSIGNLITGRTEIVNDDGSWMGTMRGYIDKATDNYHFQIELTGTDAYEGYSALLYAKGLGMWDVEGFIFPGELPAYPDPDEVPAP
jgi:hypothetical protein